MRGKLLIGTGLLLLASFLFLITTAGAEGPEDARITISGWRGEVTFTRNYTESVEGDSSVILGLTGYPTRAIEWEGIQAVLTDTLDATTFHFAPVGVTTMVTEGISTLEFDWYAMTWKASPAITMTGDVRIITLTKNFPAHLLAPVEVEWGITSQPREEAEWKGNLALLTPPAGAWTLWLGHNEAEVQTDFEPLGQDWYGIPAAAKLYLSLILRNF